MTIKLSEHFTLKEFKCNHCGKCVVDMGLVDLAEKVRAFLGGYPMHVHCVYRCPAHNKASGGVANSQHLYGRAMDFHIDELTPWTIYTRLLDGVRRGMLPELRGLFVYDWGVHIDCREDTFRHADYRKKA